MELGKILSDDKATRYATFFEREWEMYDRFWRDTGIWQTVYGHSLLTMPEFDGLIRPPRNHGAIAGTERRGSLLLGNCPQAHGPYAGEPVELLTSWD